MTKTIEKAAFSEWCVVELMGHVRLGGLVSEFTLAGEGFLRVDVPSEPPLTQIISPKAVYRITPCGEAEARAVGGGNVVPPVHRWEMPKEPPRLMRAEPSPCESSEIDDAEYAVDSFEEEPERPWDVGL